MTLSFSSALRFGCSFVVLLACLLAFSACQENLVEPVYFGTVTGTVLDARTNLPIANASVTTNPATSSYVTTSTGKFEITNVPVGRVAITVSKADYTQVVANVTVSDGQTADVSVLLSKTTTTSLAAPTQVAPLNQATGQPIEVLLKWKRPANTTPSDSLRYDVVLYESNSTLQRTPATNSRDTTALAGQLKYNTTYFWQVTVRNPAGATAKSAIWSFQTRDLPTNRYVFARTSNGNTDIYSSNETGGDLIRLTNAATVETAPQLSPNGDLIAYTSNAAGLFQLYTMNRDGSNQRRVTALSVSGYNNEGLGYRWSPDGAQFILAHNDQLWRINRDGSGLQQLATAPAGYNFRECDWTNQGGGGGRIIAQIIGSNPYDSDLLLYNVDGSNPTRLLPASNGRLSSPSFSPDGRSVAYTHDEGLAVYPTGRQTDVHIFVRRLDGSSTVDLSVGSGSTSGGKAAGFNDLYPRYTANGAQLLFVYVENPDGSVPNVYKMDLDGRARVSLITNATLPDNK
jgi:TolB protein